VRSQEFMQIYTRPRIEGGRVRVRERERERDVVLLLLLLLLAARYRFGARELH